MSSVEGPTFKRGAEETGQVEAPKRQRMSSDAPQAAAITEIYQKNTETLESPQKLLKTLDKSAREVIEQLLPQPHSIVEVRRLIPFVTDHTERLSELAQKLPNDPLLKKVVVRYLFLIGEERVASGTPYLHELLEQKLSPEELKVLEHTLFSIDRQTLFTSLYINSDGNSVDWRAWIKKVPHELRYYDMIVAVEKIVPSPHLEELVKQKPDEKHLFSIRGLTKMIAPDQLARSWDAFAYANGGTMDWISWSDKTKEQISNITYVLERLQRLNQNPWIQAVAHDLITSPLSSNKQDKVMKNITDWIDKGCQYEEPLMRRVMTLDKTRSRLFIEQFYSVPQELSLQLLNQFGRDKVGNSEIENITRVLLQLDSEVIPHIVSYLLRFIPTMNWKTHGPLLSLISLISKSYITQQRDPPLVELLKQNLKLEQVKKLELELDALKGKKLPDILDFVEAATGEMDWNKHGQHLQLFAHIYENYPDEKGINLVKEILSQNPSDADLCAIKAALLELKPENAQAIIDGIKKVTGSMDWIRCGPHLKFYTQFLKDAAAIDEFRSLMPTPDTLRDIGAIYANNEVCSIDCVKQMVQLYRSLQTPTFRKTLVSYLGNISHLDQIDIPYTSLAKLLPRLEAKGEALAHLVPFLLFSPRALMPVLENKLDQIDPNNPESLWSPSEMQLYRNHLEKADAATKNELFGSYYIDVRNVSFSNPLLHAAEHYLQQQSFQWISSGERPLTLVPGSGFLQNDFNLYFMTPRRDLPESFSIPLYENMRKTLEGIRPARQLQMCCWEFAILTLIRSGAISEDVVRKLYSTQNESLAHLIVRALTNDVALSTFPNIEKQTVKPGDLLLYETPTGIRHVSIYHSQDHVIELVRRRVAKTPFTPLGYEAVRVLPAELAARNIHTFATRHFNPDKPPEIDLDTFYEQLDLLHKEI